jgi:hypothetical protein
MADIRELVMRLKVQLESGQIAQAKSEIDTLAQSFEAGAAKGTVAYGNVNTALGGVVSTSTAAKEQTVALADGADAAGTKGAAGIGKLNTALSSAGNFLTTLATGFIMFTIPNMLMDAFSKIGQYLKEAAAAALEEETAMAKLRGALSTVTTDYQDLADVVNSWSLNAAQNSLNSQEAIIEAFQRMVSIGVPVSESYRSVQMAIDLAAARGKDLQSVTEAIAKAYEGNYTQLTRLVPEIKSAVREGAGFNEIMDLLGKYSGAAATGMQGLIGAIQTTKVTADELKEGLGQIQLAIGMAFAPDVIATFNNLGLGDTNTRILELKLKIADVESGTQNWAKSAYDAVTGMSGVSKITGLLEGHKQTLDEMRESLKKLQDEQEMLTRLQEAGFSTTQIESYMKAWGQGTVFARDRVEEAVRAQEDYNRMVSLAQAEITKIGDTWDDAGMAAGSVGNSVEDIAAATEATTEASREWFQTMQDIRGITTSIAEEQLKYAELTGGDVGGAQQGVLDSIEAQLEGQRAIVTSLEEKKAAQGLSLEEEKKLQAATLEVWKLLNDQKETQDKFTEAVTGTVDKAKEELKVQEDKLALIAAESDAKIAQINAEATAQERLTTLASQREVYEMKVKAALDAQLMVMEAMIGSKATVKLEYSLEDLQKMSLFEAAALAKAGMLQDYKIGQKMIDELIAYYDLIGGITTMPIDPNAPIIPGGVPGGIPDFSAALENATDKLRNFGIELARVGNIAKGLAEYTSSAVSGLAV